MSLPKECVILAINIFFENLEAKHNNVRLKNDPKSGTNTSLLTTDGRKIVATFYCAGNDAEAILTYFNKKQLKKTLEQVISSAENS